MTTWDDLLSADPQLFWGQVYLQVFGWSDLIPPVPDSYETRKVRLSELGFVPVYLSPRLADVLETFFPCRLKDYSEKHREKIPLQGRWVAVETVSKPDKSDPRGYGKGADLLAQAIEIGDRRVLTFNAVNDVVIPKVSELFGLCPSRVQLPSREEYRAICYLFQWIEYHLNTKSIQDMTHTFLYEMCRNVYHRTDGRGQCTHLDRVTAWITGGVQTFFMYSVSPDYVSQSLVDASQIGFRLIID